MVRTIVAAAVAQAARTGEYMLSRRLAAVLTTATAGLLLLGTPAAASGGEIGGSGSHYHLTNGWEGRTDVTFSYGRANDVVYVGDWNNDGIDTLAVRRGATYHFTNRLTGGDADRVVTYGRPNDTVLMGDWNGDGVDTPVVRRGATYHFKNDLSGGDADRVITYGRADDVVMVGDWNGNGTDTIGLRTSRAGQAPPPGLSAFDTRMLQLINAERAEAGVPAVRAWPALRDGAVRHSQWMARTGTFQHASEQTIVSDGRRAGCDASAENIAWGSSHYAQEPSGLMEGYMNSPGHRANILDRNNRFVAVGSVQADNGRVYNTQRFARSCS